MVTKKAYLIAKCDRIVTPYTKAIEYANKKGYRFIRGLQ